MISKELHGPWAVIAGGSEGIGVSFAERVAAQGINLVLLARKAGPLEETATAVREKYGVEVRTQIVDLTAPDMMEQIRSATDDIEVGLLIYNAGAAGGPEPLVDQPIERPLGTIALNVIGQTMLAHHFGRGMRDRGRGGVILIGSLGCIAGTMGLSVYTAVKSYTQTFAEGLWAEMRPHGVDVLAAMIGRTLTPGLERAGLGSTDEAPAADPDDIAALALDNLQDGPVVVPPEHQKTFDAMRSMPRRKAVEIMIKSMEAQLR